MLHRDRSSEGRLRLALNDELDPETFKYRKNHAFIQPHIYIEVTIKPIQRTNEDAAKAAVTTCVMLSLNFSLQRFTG